MAVKALYLGKAIVKVIMKQYALSAIFWPILKSNDLKRLYIWILGYLIYGMQ